MKTEEIKLDIKNQISKIDKSFGTYAWINIYEDGLYEIDVVRLEKILKKTKWHFKFSFIVTIFLSTLLFVLAFGPKLTERDVINIDALRLLIIITFIFILNTFKNYKFKASLENKIYLINLWNRVKDIK